MGKYELYAEVDQVRLDVWLSEQLKDLSRTYIKKLIDEQKVLVNGKLEKSKYKVSKSDLITIDIPEPELLQINPENIPIDIVYEDIDIVVVNKQKGMVVHPAVGNYTGTLVNALLYHCGDSLSDINGVIRPGIVHRIDKDTTGILVAAKNNMAHEYLSAKLKRHDITRRYIALVEGNINEDTGRIDMPIGRHPTDRKRMAVNTNRGRHAVTHFNVISRFGKYTLVQLALQTGRTHQIRVHMSHIGYPVVGDTVYGRKNPVFDTQGQMLHAMVLGFEHPRTGQYMEFMAELPLYFKEILDNLKDI